MSRVLADTSVWLEMFRHPKSVVTSRFGRLLLEGDICLNGLVWAELLSGSRSQAEFDRLEEMLRGLPLLADPPDLWRQIARARFQLARTGFQASVADLVIAVSAMAHKKVLFSLDRDFKSIQKALPGLILMPQ